MTSIANGESGLSVRTKLNASLAITDAFSVSSGNVGIGTTSPVTLLHLSSVDPVYVTMVDQGNGAGRIGQNGTAMTFGVDSVNGATERMRIDSAGNVGIGTTSPNSTNGTVLNLYNSQNTGTVASNTSVIVESVNRNATFQTRIPATGTASVLTYNTDGTTLYGGMSVIGNSGSPNTLFFVGASERMRIDASGNVGIGNTAPVAKLHVTGASITTGVVYKAQPAQTSKAAAATLTIAELLTGIVQYTGAAATLTLPTGTSIEGGLPATFPTDMSFDVSFINTGAGLLTIGANGNTTVGTITVATLTSAMLRFRKTAANTYTVYRIS